MLQLLFKGMGLGFSIAAPVGPIGVLCISRSLKKGFLSGFISGIGAATADLIYGSIAGFGVLWLSPTAILALRSRFSCLSGSSPESS